jgi:membrane protease YdiL (CAAX protease family)
MTVDVALMRFVEPVLFIGILFGWHLFCRDSVAAWFVRASNFGARLPHRVGLLIARIPFYGLPGILGYFFYTSVLPAHVMPIGARLSYVPAGLVLGGGMIMFSASLANGAYVTFHHFLFGYDQNRLAKLDLRVAKDSGWIRTYTLAYKELSLGLFLLFCAFAVIGEEAAFRGVLLPLLVSAMGQELAITLTVVLFVAIQVPFMPSLYSAVIPMCGAAVVGVVLGYVAVTTHSLFLCTVAHIGYLMATIVIFMVWDDPSYFYKQHANAKNFQR